MTKTLAFDVYGTLIDTHGVVDLLDSMVGDKAVGFSQAWRDKQLEYSFRRALMGRYESFAVCTRQALDHTVEAFGITLAEANREQLMMHYLELPVFADVEECLLRLQTAGHRLYAFSNGTREAVDRLLNNAAIRHFFIDIVSVDEIKTFKPDPATYRHFLKRSNASEQHSWLVSSNPFDVLGAISAGLSAAWVQRSNQAVFDPWNIEPTVSISTLAELGGCLE